MHKLLSLIFILCLVFIGVSRTFELNTGPDYIYVRADFPRFAANPWFGVEWGARSGVEGLYDSLKAQVK